MSVADPAADSFYTSREWRRLRYRVLRKHGHRCMSCGLTPDQGVKIHVDHIKPRSLFPDLALEFSNLQVLCEVCNLGKSNEFSDDLRYETKINQQVGIVANAPAHRTREAYDELCRLVSERPADQVRRMEEERGLR